MRRLLFAAALLIAAPLSVARAATDRLSTFLGSFADSEFHRWDPRPSPVRIGGVLSDESRTILFIGKKTRTFSLHEHRFDSPQRATNAANGYLAEADSARGHLLAWELAVVKDATLYVFAAGREVSQKDFEATSARFLEALGAQSAPRMICRDVGGCWMEGL